MNAGRQTQNSRGRAGATRQLWSRDFVIVVLFAIFLAAIAGRLVYVQVIKGPEYAEMAATSHTTEAMLSARRGTIYDRNGEVIASTIDATTVYVDPTEVTEPEKLAATLESILGSTYEKTYDDYYALVTAEDTSFVYIQRKATVELADQLKEQLEEAGIVGIHYLDDTKRVYPNGDIGTQVIGSVDVDGVGIAGLELEYDELLSGTDGSMTREVGLEDIPIADGVIEQTDAVDGSDIVISLDIDLQKKAEESLLSTIENYNANGGSVTVMDAATGEVYASCSYSKSGTDEQGNTTYSYDIGKLWSVTDSYEPGSTFKALTALSILTNSQTTVDSTFSVADSLQVYDSVISDSHEHDTETLTLREIIAQSSNVGTVLASRNVDLAQLYETYTAFGFGQDPGIDFPGVASGILEESSDWDGVQAANVTFGQGLTVTGMQLVRAYGAIEQGGTLCVPHFLIDVPSDDELAESYAQTFGATQTVASESVCEAVADMLRAVVTEGTGDAAAIDGYTVAGKTGTAEVADSSGGYLSDTYLVSFCGWLDGSTSDLVCLVTVDRPQTAYGGGDVCGPVFADIMSFAIDNYQIGQQAG